MKKLSLQEEIQMQDYLHVATKFTSAFYAQSFIVQNQLFCRNRRNYVVPKYENREIACSVLVVEIRRHEQEARRDADMGWKALGELLGLGEKMQERKKRTARVRMRVMKKKKKTIAIYTAYRCERERRGERVENFFSMCYEEKAKRRIRPRVFW